MYNLAEYGQMIADRARMDPYAYALKSVVRSDSVVLDIGAGSGIHALLACKFGARRVFAVEPNDAIHVARQLAAANGFAGQVEFIQDLSTRITLPERADVVVSDLRGVLPPYRHHIPTIVDARERHLAVGGTLIPQSDTMWVSLVESRLAYNGIVRPWDSPYGLNMDAARIGALNSWSQDDTDLISSRNLLTEPRQIAEFDYRTVTSTDMLGAAVDVGITRAGTAHGLLVWFDASLTADIGVSNGPLSAKPADVYGRAFFPLSQPVQVEEHDSVSFEIGAELSAADYEWSWSTKIQSQMLGAVVGDFRQSTTRDCSRLDDVTGSRADDRGSLGADGLVDLFVLQALAESRTLREIAGSARAKFPGHFDDDSSAIAHVHELWKQYAE